MSWDKARTDLVVKLWREERLSALEIATRIGVTRNSVISKLHRMGLTSADGGSQKMPSGSARNAHGLGARPRRKPVPPVPATKPKPVEQTKTWRHWGAPAGAVADARKVVEPYREAPVTRVFDPAKLVRTVDLESHHCRWPVGDPQDESFRHCGERRVPGLRAPYCIRCQAIAFRPVGDVNATWLNRVSGGEIEAAATLMTPETVPAAGGAPTRELEDVP